MFDPVFAYYPSRFFVICLCGLGCFGWLIWEVASEHNAKRWPIWCLLVPAVLWTYSGASGVMMVESESSWQHWWVADLCVAPLFWLPYIVFRAHEHSQGR